MVAALTGTSAEFLIVSLAGASAAALTGPRVERLNGFVVAGATIALMTFAASAALAIAAGESDPAYLARLAGYAVANGSLSAIIAVGTLTVVGYLFGLTTTLGLNDLAHPTQPLFRRLLTEAPGTYHHSVMVANLAERAAEAIGADTLLCRVGSYYHDIGKLMHPYAFIENQMGAENIHDRLDPLTSARIIGAHVTDGIALAQAHRLPDGIRDLIAQHHGTAFIGAFYVRARQETLRSVDPYDFRYVGPKPQTKEAAILMLADSVEAAVRASESHVPEVIEEIVGKIINARLEQGELDKCDLTRRDLSQIRATFLTILHGVYHPRVPDPKPERQPAPASNTPGA